MKTLLIVSKNCKELAELAKQSHSYKTLERSRELGLQNEDLLYQVLDENNLYRYLVNQNSIANALAPHCNIISVTEYNGTTTLNNAVNYFGTPKLSSFGFLKMKIENGEFIVLDSSYHYSIEFFKEIKKTSLRGILSQHPRVLRRYQWTK